MKYATSADAYCMLREADRRRGKLYNGDTMSLDFIQETEEFQKLLQQHIFQEQACQITGVTAPAKPYLLSMLRKEGSAGLVFIRPASSSLFRFAEDCRFFLTQLGVSEKAEILPALRDDLSQDIAPSLETISARMRCFYHLWRHPQALVITNLLGLLSPFPHPDVLPDLYLEMIKDLDIGREVLLERLSNYGYDRVDLISSHGEYAWRGGIVDVFSPWSDYPFRIEFSGADIASLREFEPSSQRSLRQVEYVILPSLRERLNDRAVPFTQFAQDTRFIIDDFDSVEREWTESQEYLNDEQKELWERIKANAIRIDPLETFQADRKLSFFFQSVPRFENKIPFFLDFIQKKQEERERISVFFSNEGVRKKLANLLDEHEIPQVSSDDVFSVPQDESVKLFLGALRQGFAYPPLKIMNFSERDVFTEERILVSRPRLKPFVSDFRDMKAGDHVVHADYGIGIFNGLVKMAVNRQQEEFLEIGFRDEDKLFVPMPDLNLVQKYARLGTSPPALSKLGTPQWEKTKNRTKKAIQEMAKELLNLYAQRKTVPGYSFSVGGNWTTEFEKTFEYRETDDQIRSIEEVMADMASDVPMDRLLCGDVGYGKTEVAIRAAFQAVMDGKQVAVLCPTTVLASQHLKTFRRRMLLFPVRVEGLTRLQTRAQQKKILEDLEQGLVDVIIGTHRLLSQDVRFHDPGLLVIDEEQRFGVKHKEKIKQMKADIDVLTMTATPIPRTLNLSLASLRDISLIETPPKDRLAIHTVVTSFSRQLITGAIRKELSRGGQVYFIHNRVEDIDTMAVMIENWIPEAKVATVHGQMSGAVLEKRMIDFVGEKYNVLISTTIIENGIDIPLVNTLIVNRADRFGLAQLYQLRGRVGRSSRQAVAYFLVPPFSELTPLARERLKALKEFSELGSGFRLAAKDLEIRGAGDFLGSKQHGFIEAVGFDYYMQLLENSIRELKGEAIPDVKSKLNLKIPIRIPDDYIPQVNLRLNLYKRISSVKEEEALHKIREEVEDRYGTPPKGVENLFRYGRIRYLANRIKIKEIDRIGSKLVFKFLPDSSADLSRLTQIIQSCQGSITPQGVLSLKLAASGDTKFLDETIDVLKELSLI